MQTQVDPVAQQALNAFFALFSKAGQDFLKTKQRPAPDFDVGFAELAFYKDKYQNLFKAPAENVEAIYSLLPENTPAMPKAGFAKVLAECFLDYKSLSPLDHKTWAIQFRQLLQAMIFEYVKCYPQRGMELEVLQSAFDTAKQELTSEGKLGPFVGHENYLTVCDNVVKSLLGLLQLDSDLQKPLPPAIVQKPLKNPLTISEQTKTKIADHLSSSNSSSSSSPQSPSIASSASSLVGPNLSELFGSSTPEGLRHLGVLELSNKLELFKAIKQQILQEKFDGFMEEQLTLSNQKLKELQWRYLQPLMLLDTKAPEIKTKLFDALKHELREWEETLMAEVGAEYNSLMQQGRIDESDEQNFIARHREFFEDQIDEIYQQQSQSPFQIDFAEMDEANADIKKPLVTLKLNQRCTLQMENRHHISIKGTEPFPLVVRKPMTISLDGETELSIKVNAENGLTLSAVTQEKKDDKRQLELEYNIVKIALDNWSAGQQINFRVPNQAVANRMLTFLDEMIRQEPEKYPSLDIKDVGLIGTNRRYTINKARAVNVAQNPSLDTTLEACRKVVQKHQESSQPVTQLVVARPHQ